MAGDLGRDGRSDSRGRALHRRRRGDGGRACERTLTELCVSPRVGLGRWQGRTLQLEAILMSMSWSGQKSDTVRQS